MKLGLILAIDTSCDDTSVAVTCGTQVLSNVIASQTQLHKPYGGVFPTVAKLAHRENIDKTVAIALKRAHVSMADIAALAVTVGPGLAPALEVGIAAAKALAQTHAKPLIACNHLEGHLLSVLAEPLSGSARKQAFSTTLLEQDQLLLPADDLKVKLPALSLIISGGNTLFVLVKDVGTYEVLGRTLDDAAGECLDKIGRMLNLGYPAGPVMEEFARLGNKDAYPFPLPLTTVKTYDVSFSGMKTFARNLLDTLTAERPLNRQEMYDFCASAQQGVFRHICYKLTKILEDLYAQAYTKNYANVAFSSQQNKDFAVQGVWLGGGVAANMTLRKMLRDTLRNFTKKNSLTSLRLRTPYTKRLCADNAAMIGVVAGVTEKIRFTVENLAFVERAPRLPLDGN